MRSFPVTEDACDLSFCGSKDDARRRRRYYQIPDVSLGSRGHAPHRTGHVLQGFSAFEADLCKFTGWHALDQELCFDECQRTYLICYIDKEISLGYFVYCSFVYFHLYLLSLMFILICR